MSDPPKRKVFLKVISEFTNNDLIEHKLEDGGHVEFCESFLSPYFSKKLFEIIVINSDFFNIL